jgi:hypothetical protein
VLSTDYTTYSLVYTCRQITPFLKVQFSWILSRETTLSSEYTAPLFATMATLGVNQTMYHQTVQTDCNQYQ